MREQSASFLLELMGEAHICPLTDNSFALPSAAPAEHRKVMLDDSQSALGCSVAWPHCQCLSSACVLVGSQWWRHSVTMLEDSLKQPQTMCCRRCPVSQRPCLGSGHQKDTPERHCSCQPH